MDIPKTMKGVTPLNWDFSEPGRVIEVKGDFPPAANWKDFVDRPLETGDGSRKDAGKDAGFWLIPRRPLIALAHVYAIGAAKYAPRGWEAGMEWSRIVDPMWRHLLKWMSGEKFDPVDGQHHLSAVAWACFALMEYEETHPEMDDLKRNG